MSEKPHQKQDFLELAKRQFAQISAEFEKALDTLKDPERRKQMTASYLDMLQKGLSRAQESIARYQEKVAPQTTAEPSSLAHRPPAAHPGRVRHIRRSQQSKQPAAPSPARLTNLSHRASAVAWQRRVMPHP
jgi:hypothetical protein